MDKRTLLFIFCVTASLFVVNLYFNADRAEKQREWLQQNEELELQKKERLATDIERRTARFADLPVVYLYDAPEEGNFLGYGVAGDYGILTLLPPEKASEKIYWKEGMDSLVSFELKRLTEAKGEQDPLWYGMENTTEIPVADTEHLRTPVDVQLIVSDEASGRAVVGEFSQGMIHFPLAPLTQWALALVEQDGEYLPLGIYDPSTQYLHLLKDYSTLREAITIVEKPELVPVEEKTQEQFYVLENKSVQFVFSSQGAALAEVNLPFATKENTQSRVQEVELDRQMVEEAPANALFPSRPAWFAGIDAPMQGREGGYYPLLRRDLVLDRGGVQARFRVPAHYYALAIVSPEYPEVAQLHYQVKAFDSRSITFEARQSYRKITKTFRLPEEGSAAPYCLDVEIEVEGDNRGLWLSSGVVDVELFSGSATNNLQYRITNQNKAEMVKVDLPKEVTKVGSLKPDWFAIGNGFFGLILDPLQNRGVGYQAEFVSGETLPTRLVALKESRPDEKAQRYPAYLLRVPLEGASHEPLRFRLIAGPLDKNMLSLLDETFSDTTTGYDPDYTAAISFHGFFSFISEPFSKFLMVILDFFHRVTDSWVLSIVLLTVVLRLLLFPLNSWSMKSMRRMQQLTPEIAALQKRYKKDSKRLQMEMMTLYRERGVNPLGGCFPILIQMPFLIGMFDLLRSTFSLRGATFVAGWIDDLSAPDVLLQWDTSIPLIGNALHLLPLLLGGIMFLQQRMTATFPKDKALLTDQQKQQKLMGNMMVIVFTVMFYNFPSGLNIYWLSSMLLGMGQQWLINRRLGPPVTTIVEEVDGAKKKKTKRVG